MKLAYSDRLALIIKLLISSEHFLTAEDISEQLHVSKRNVYYTIKDINELLSRKSESKIVTIYGKGMKINERQKNILRQFLGQGDNLDIHSLTQKERYSLLFCELYCSNEILKIKDFENLFEMSRFTIIDDINALKEELDHFALEMIYDNKLGYTLSGNEGAKRRAFYYFFSEIYEIIKNQNYMMGRFTFFGHDVILHYQKLKKIESNGIEYYECSVLALACVITNIIKGNSLHFHKGDELPKTAIQKEYDFINGEYPFLPELEKRYIAICLYCSSITRGETFFEKSQTEILARKMNDIFYLLSTIKIDNDKEFFDFLVKHLDISFLRYKYGISIDNPLIKELKTKYSTYFNIVKQATKVIELETGTPISDNEVGFLVLYYVGYAKKIEKEIPNISAILICANGVSSSYLLKNAIEKYDSRIKIRDCMTIKQYYEQKNEVDLIITNLDDESFINKENVIKIHSFLTSDDQILISNKVSKILFEKSSKSYDEENMHVLFNEFEETNHNYMSKIINNDQSFAQSEIFKLHFVQIEKEELADWKEYIRYAAKPLIQENYIQMDYCNQIIENIEKYGSYMVYRNGYLLGHASIELSHKLGLSFLRLNNEIDVKGSKVSKIFIFTPINKKDHIPTLTSLVTLLESDEIDKMIVNAKNELEIYNCIMSIIHAL